MTFLSAAIIVPVVVFFLGTALTEVNAAITDLIEPEVTQVSE